MAPLAAGALVLAAALAFGRAPVDGSARTPPVSRLRAEPLREASARACAGCHPSQVAAWERSVMAFASRSPLFGALESAVEELAFQDARCPEGAGVLRVAGAGACRASRSGVSITGSGGEHWCVNCHAGGSEGRASLPAWDASFAGASSRRPVRDLLSAGGLEGVSCAVCHANVATSHDRGGPRPGNATWTSPESGRSFDMRPEERLGLFGIGNSGYRVELSSFLLPRLDDRAGTPIVHARTSPAQKEHLRSSEACGACHDVRLFGADAAKASFRPEPFKRLRNAYSEWRAWADDQRALGRRAATCQDCHMSLFPGVCVPGASPGSEGGCPAGFHFEKRAPGDYPRAFVATSSSEPTPSHVHAFTSVDVPLAAEYPAAWADDASLDEHGLPRGLETRRLQLLRSALRFSLGEPQVRGRSLEVPVTIENVGAGHRVPAGFSQERELWVELVVRDARGRVVYEVGRVASDTEDLHDKVMTRVTTRGDSRDEQGRPLGVFGADVVDGPDVPSFRPDGRGRLRGRGLVNLQNGFFRCVRCIGVIDAAGRCQPGPGQGRTRADRYDDGDYDADTGVCSSNLSGEAALFETYFPVGSLDAERGTAKAPDAILDTRSLAPGASLSYVYDLETGGAPRPFSVEAKLRFRAFPPFLIRAFAAYEAEAARLGRRPSGPQVRPEMAGRNRIVDLAEAKASVP